MRLILLSLAFLAPAASAAPRKAADVKGPTLEDCLASRTCRHGIVDTSFPAHLSAMLNEVEAALPGRFFKGVAASALRKMDDQGHFTRLDCPSQGPRSPCGQSTQELFEERLLQVALLRALPLDDEQLTRCFDAQTWEILPPGEKILKKARSLWPGMMKSIAEATAKRMGQKH